MREEKRGGARRQREGPLPALCRHAHVRREDRNGGGFERRFGMSRARPRSGRLPPKDRRVSRESRRCGITGVWRGLPPGRAAYNAAGRLQRPCLRAPPWASGVQIPCDTTATRRGLRLDRKTHTPIMIKNRRSIMGKAPSVCGSGQGPQNPFPVVRRYSDGQ